MGLFTYAKYFSRAMTKYHTAVPKMQIAKYNYRLSSTIINPSAFLIKSPEFQTMIASLGGIDSISTNDDDEESSLIRTRKDTRG
ncbi:unnamed protein product [Blepharisma stoltei]|uniref:Uncharacterized protein n=1 Tax=Blepharisma stoltei TaxID=1481888 RepID=A0AAU9IUE1_9CILI|nr:unnamed protein product [Blepharisma stoltei]